MLTSEARIATDRASRYLSQLGRHADQMGQGLRHRPRAHGAGGAPPEVEHTEWSDARGVIEFGWGRCVMEATQDTLILRAEAADEEGLRRIQDGIARRIGTIGRRDQLTATWQPAVPGDPTDTAPAQREEAPPHRRRIITIGLTILVVLVVAVHVGLFGDAVKSSPWTKWGVNAIVALVLVKVVLIAGHVFLTRRAIRRRKRPATPTQSDEGPAVGL